MVKRNFLRELSNEMRAGTDSDWTLINRKIKQMREELALAKEEQTKINKKKENTELLNTIKELLINIQCSCPKKKPCPRCKIEINHAKTLLKKNK